MATAPYGVRLLVGAATVAVEETMKLPKTILMYPMTLVSQAAQAVMRFQQNMAELVIKGDATLETLFPPRDEKPNWATFDEDLDDALASAPAPRTEGRFALYSPPHEPASGTLDAPTARLSTDHMPTDHAKKPATNSAVPVPPVAEELDYETLTLAQLRARLNTLDVAELEALLAYEEATRARAPFQTLLANRITRATAK
ncbi:lipid droplet-associated protein [Mycobacterium sp.]|uniref:lipid droplet-associated protein n=1 Tax=Mycobacterium sp. TaxID=1785 RepID=UPI00126EDAEB|nr:lipid droplet-associated protein [Mycobacterium sp.]KAA8966281.1 MAG: lipid droplet-associated protein [Mycobacterium sp.]